MLHTGKRQAWGGGGQHYQIVKHLKPVSVFQQSSLICTQLYTETALVGYSFAKKTLGYIHVSCFFSVLLKVLQLMGITRGFTRVSTDMSRSDLRKKPWQTDLSEIPHAL